MDHIPSTDNERVTDAPDLQYDSLVDPPAENIFENSSNSVDNGISSGANNEVQLFEKPLVSLFETNDAISECDVSSTSCAKNEVILNNDDPVVENYSTCEAVESFKNVNDLCSKEVEVECCSEQPNVDMSIHGNTNNSVEELPSPSDHINVSSAPDHVELPSLSHQIELPPCDQIELPSESDKIELPPASDNIDSLSASDLTEQPSASVHSEEPTATDYFEQPSASDCIEQPSTSDHMKPASEFDHTEPLSASDHAEPTSASDHAEPAFASDHTEPISASDHTEPISASDHLEPPPTSDHTKPTSASDYPEPPSTSDEAEPLSAADRIEPPAAIDHIDQPSVLDYTEQPSASDHVELPSAFDHTDQLSVPDHIEPPSTSDPIELPSASDHPEQPSTLDHSEPSSASDHVKQPSASEEIEPPSLSDHNEVSPPFDDASASSLPCAMTNINGEVSPNAESVANPDSSYLPKEDAEDVPEVQNVCDNPSIETNPNNDEVVDHQNDFLPTIVAIRGGCTDVLEKSNSQPEDVSSTPPQIPSLNIVNVLGGCKDLDTDNDISKTNAGSSAPKESDFIVPTIGESEKTTNPNECMVPKGSDHGTIPLTSEFPIKADETSNTKVEDPEVICIETTPKIPSPIPIKMESSIESLNVEPETRSSNKAVKFTAKKRLTRSSLTQSEDCIILSSSSDVDSASDSKKRNRSATITYSTAGYTCHLCNTVFHEHELLNEHMILHRNNSLIEAKVQNRSKMTKLKGYSCVICQKQLSTSQSLQQHVLIHKNEKSFVCTVCQKEFRNLQNYRVHLQKHKTEQRRHGTQLQGVKAQLDKSVVRGADFGRLVGPLFMKESLWHQEKDASSSKNLPSNSSVPNKKSPFKFTTKEPVSHQPRLSFDQPPFKTNANASSSSPVIIRRREPSPDVWSDEECVAVKSFSNIESVVMNAAKIIVKLDNLDTSVLKRKLQTPDISIDLPPKKCRVMLSPIAEKCNIKLDEIENIPMDIDVGEMDLPAAEPMVGDRDNLNDKIEDTANSSVCPPRSTLTDNELFNLLNDDTISADSADHGSSAKSQIPKPDQCAVDNSTTDSIRKVASPVPKRSNVIFMEAAPPNYEMCAYEDEETIDSRLDDAFDTAFQKVAIRRLALLRKRATENGGKIESRYLLGPLFWRKALRRAQKQAGGTTPVANVDITFSSGKSRGAPLKTRPSLFGGRSRFDNRRTNDPTKLQLRAERKFKYLLELAKMLSDLNSVNLAGPLFWRRTLQLAGVHRGEDLRMHVNVTTPTLDGIEFVGDGGQPCDFNDALVNAEKMAPSEPIQPSNQVQPSSHPVLSSSDPVQLLSRVQPSPSKVPASTVSDQLVADKLSFVSNVAGGVSKMPDQTPTVLSEPLRKDAATNTSNEVSPLKTDSILYESLTKPKEKQQQSTKPEGAPPSYVDSTRLLEANEGTTVESAATSQLKAEVAENCSNDLNTQCPESTGDVTVDEGVAKLEAMDSGSIVLNVDGGGGLQLIPAGDNPLAGAGQNFVLVSDGSGQMQYMVNVPSDNFSNFELLGNGAAGEQVAYAIQFDGENYAAVQFVQDADIQLPGETGLKETQMLVDPKAATYLVADAAAPAAAVADPNHIGKELSDFLNLDYGNLLKNGTADQPIS